MKFKAPWLSEILVDEKFNQKEAVEAAIDECTSSCPSGLTFCRSSFLRSLEEIGLRLIPHPEYSNETWAWGNSTQPEKYTLERI